MSIAHRLVFVPEKMNGQMGYRFHGSASLIKLLSRTVPELSPAGGGSMVIFMVKWTVASIPALLILVLLALLVAAMFGGIVGGLATLSR